MKRVYLRLKCLRSVNPQFPQLGKEHYHLMVDAYQNVPHMAIHRTDECWSITHIPTGYMLYSGLSHLWIAARYCQVFNAMADWNFTNPNHIKENLDDYQLIYELVGKHPYTEVANSDSAMTNHKLVRHHGYTYPMHLLKEFMDKKEVPCACITCGYFEMGHFEASEDVCPACTSATIQSIYFLEGAI